MTTDAWRKLLAGDGLPLLIGSFGAAEAAEVHACSGAWPGLLGAEYCRGYGIHELDEVAQAIDWRGQNPALVAHAGAGGVGRVLSHLPNPCRPRLGGLRDQDAAIAAILAEGTPERARWQALVDAIADGFDDLAAQDATVIYGPLHEMNCRGFWWGAAGLRTPHLFRALWRDLHDHIALRRGCRNVLWLYAPLANDNDPIVEEMYPGDDVVDLVGLDVYAASLVPYTPQYRTMQGYGKPFMLSEYGPMAWNVPEHEPSGYDCLTLLDEVASHWPATRACMFWGGHFGAARQQRCRELMDDPRACDRQWLQERLSPAPAGQAGSHR